MTGYKRNRKPLLRLLGFVLSLTDGEKKEEEKRKKRGGSRPEDVAPYLASSSQQYSLLFYRTSTHLLCYVAAVSKRREPLLFLSLFLFGTCPFFIIIYHCFPSSSYSLFSPCRVDAKNENEQRLKKKRWRVGSALLFFCHGTTTFEKIRISKKKYLPLHRIDSPCAKLML